MANDTVVTQQPDGANLGPPTPPSMTPEEANKHGYRSIRYNANERERQKQQERIETFWLHSRPDSVLIAAMGNHWSPGSWQRVMDLLHYTNEQGYFVGLDELQDRCFSPYDALGSMRNEAIMRASQGFDWLLYVDNDVLPEKETLVRLIKRQQPVIAPYVEEPGTGKPLHGPHMDKWTGLQPIRWCVLSMVLFRVNVFLPWHGEFWNNAIGADEGYHFQKLWMAGHRPWLDTDVILPVAKTPTYPLATNRMQKPDADAFWDQRRAWLLKAPDRRPIDPNDIHQKDGEYLPFMPLKAPELPPGTGTFVPAQESGTSGSEKLVAVNGHSPNLEAIAALRR